MINIEVEARPEVETPILVQALDGYEIYIATYARRLNGKIVEYTAQKLALHNDRLRKLCAPEILKASLVVPFEGVIKLSNE